MTSDSTKGRGDTNARAIILGLVAVISAGGLFWCSAILTANTIPQSALSQIAGVVLATGLLSVGWELIGRRKFNQEVMATARLSADVTASGITRVTDLYLQEVEWDELFDGVTNLDILVAYGRTWRNSYRDRLVEVAKRRGTKIRVFLPDPDDEQTMKILAERFHLTPEDLKRTVEEAIADFSSVASPNGGEVEVWIRPGDAVFSCYRFDRRAVVTLYSHSQRRTSVPTFAMKEGTLFAFVQREIDAIEEQSDLVFPKPQRKPQPETVTVTEAITKAETETKPEEHQ